MSKSKSMQHEGHGIAASLKAVLLISVIGVLVSVFVAFEAPQVFVAPDEPLASVADASVAADGPRLAAHDAASASAAAAPPDIHATATPSEYFPSRFGAPQSTPEEPVSTF